MKPTRVMRSPPHAALRALSSALAVSVISFVLTLLPACAHPNRPIDPVPQYRLLHDPARSRDIPIWLYGAGPRPRPLAVISPGYGVSANSYAYIAQGLVRRGFVVASISHDLPGDPEPARSGNLQVLRRPIWQRGADSIVFVAETLGATGLVSPSPLVLVGHSYGGDLSMLLAATNPGIVRLVFSLDNRRMPVPRTTHPRICTVRSIDQVADPGVLPSEIEAAQLGMIIAQVPDLRHDAMDDTASPRQRRAVLDVLDDCLRR